MIKDIFTKYSKNDFIIGHKGLKLSYGQFWESSLSYAKKLELSGCREGDFVIIKLENCVEYLKLYIACILKGLVACPLDPKILDHRYKKLLADINPKLVIDNIETLNNVNDDKKINEFSIKNSDFDCIMLQSSGTTSSVKGILHTSKSLINSAISFSRISGITQKTVVYHHFPMFYMAGVFNMFLCPLVSGSKIVLGQRFSKNQMFSFWETPVKFGVNNLTLTPTMAMALAKLHKNHKSKNYISNIEQIVSTSSYLHKSVYDEFEKIFSNVLQTCYGVTEVGGSITYTSKNDAVRFNYDTGSCGKEIKFKYKGSKKDPVEIIIKTPFMMSGYFRNGKKVSGLRNGYFNTGDIGYVKNGKLFLTGRKSDMIKKGGEFISLNEIEDTLLKSNIVEEMCVLGIDDNFWSNKILVFFTHRDGKNFEEIKENLINFGLKYLSEIEMPDEFIHVNSFPKTSIGKIKKNELIKFYDDRKSK